MAGTVAFKAQSLSASSLTTYTFSAMAIGTASADRIVVVAISAVSTTVGLTVSSVTIGGITATDIGLQKQGGTGPYNDVAIFYANVPTGTTATVVVTWSGGVANCGVETYECHGIKSVPTATASDQNSSGAALALTLTIQAGGIAIASAGHVNTGGARGMTWAQLVEDADAASSAQNTVSSASNAYATLQTNLAITATPAGAFAASGLVAAWQPSLSLAANSGSFALTGIALALLKGKTLAASAGAFGLTGFSVLFPRKINLAAVRGVYSVTGIAVSWKRAIHLVAATGTYALTGLAAVLNRGRNLIAAKGTFAVSGVALIVAHIAAAADKFLLRRSPPTLQKLRNSDPTLTD